jgi:hypothetical protein
MSPFNSPLPVEIPGFEVETHVHAVLAPLPNSTRINVFAVLEVAADGGLTARCCGRSLGRPPRCHPLFRGGERLAETI